ncbi:zincin-like metallopeptidase toxin domain-containing protein [Paenibacillus dendritiformis]|uniref:zincin-like metallopeptidase toxin domain-containing protein n=1 Tax=Paenibacillus dendritiformis TaxID=130049 RepID=UPI001F0DE7DA|nr:zincin-like metallopeptidase toxin domain-containing protein [Paenibacillus dendritiformis]
MSSGKSGKDKKEMTPQASSGDKKSYVVAGAILSCSYGSQPSHMGMQMSHGVYVKGKPIMNVMDHIPNVNIMPFGTCGSMQNPAVAAATAAKGGLPQRVPCTPMVMMPWLGGKTDKLVDNYPSLLNDSTNMCMFCGKIKVEDDGQNLDYSLIKILSAEEVASRMQGPPEDTREWYEKAWDSVAQTGEEAWSAIKKSGNSIAEIGSDLWKGLEVRANKAFDSPYDFGNWLTVGAFDAAGGIYEGAKIRANKRNESAYDYMNWLSAGMVDTFNGAFNPDDPLSKEHWLNSFGALGYLVGAKGGPPKSGGPTLPKVNVPEKPSVPKVAESTSSRARTTVLDLAEWDTKRVRGNVFKIDKYGNRKIRASDFKKLKKDMDKEGIEVKIDKIKVPKDKAGGFDPETGIMYFREKPSQIAAFHESIHAKQWLELGKEKYLKQSFLEREEHVYKIIMENKKNFTRAELIATERYIYKLRTGQRPPFGWPPSDSEIFRGCLDE